MEEAEKVKESSKGVYSIETLTRLYGVDIISAASSSAMVAPLISIVDRSIIENANGKRALGDGLVYGLRSFVKHPFRFVGSPQFRLVLGVYFSTYTAANFVDTTCEHQRVDPVSTSLIKFAMTSSVNMLLCIYKDRAFTRMFGTASARQFPILSYFLFAARDSLTVAASFNLPTVFAAYLQDNQLASSKTAPSIAQLVCPSVVQFLSTPMHLYALDLYNRPTASFSQRSILVRREYFKSAIARIGRIGPAFGIGGIGNTYFRSFRERVKPQHQQTRV